MIADNPRSARGGIDLHAHSQASDGTDSPSELVAKAVSLGLSCIALTDHDTMGGLKEAKSTTKQLEIDFVPGIELSIEDGETKRFHLLSYFFDIDDPALSAVLENVRRWRSDRNSLMLERAKRAGIDLTEAEVRAEAAPDATVIGRPHFASALVKKGLASSIQDAFDRYLANGQILHEPKPSLSPAQAAKLLHAAGGITILAHPGLIRWADRAELKAYIAELKGAGILDGIECYYSRYDEEQTQFFLGIAEDLKLLVSGGSDYHGDNKPDISLGAVYHNQPLPESILIPLRAASAQRRSGHSTGS
jgi:predicted metal-dependent phosphoesterase TrpH